MLIKFDLDMIADGLGIDKSDVIELFTDGRPASFLMKRKIAHEKKWILGDKNADYDWIDEDQNFVECRVLTENGVSFLPNKNIGFGRGYNERDFIKKLNFIKYYIVADVTEFPNVYLTKVPSEKIEYWHFRGNLNGCGKIAKSKFYKLMGMGLST